MYDVQEAMHLTAMSVILQRVVYIYEPPKDCPGRRGYSPIQVPNRLLPFCLAWCLPFQPFFHLGNLRNLV